MEESQTQVKRTGWSGEEQEEQERGENEYGLLPSHVLVSSYILWAFKKCFES